jgi:hypothetical protein
LAGDRDGAGTYRYLVMEVAKSMTIRLTDEQAAQLEAVSQADGIPGFRLR